MAPGLAIEAIGAVPKGGLVLDPMAGSGTVVAIARSMGRRALGFDLDPLAVLMARAWTQTIDANAVRSTAERVLIRARRCASRMAIREAYPADADDETRSFVRYWFDPYVRKQLAALSVAISDVEAGPAKDALWCAFSRQIVAKQAGVSLALDLSHSRPHRAFHVAPRKPFRIFMTAVEQVIGGSVQRSSRLLGPAASVQVGDVRSLPLEDSCIDLVFTSPPYLNAIDYLRCSKFSLVWMGHSIGEIRSVRSVSIGAEVGAAGDATGDRIVSEMALSPALPSRMLGILNRYVLDTRTSIKEIARVLKPTGRIVYVVGENTVGKTFIPTGRLVTRIAHSQGLRLVSRRIRTLPANRRYLPPPGSGGRQLDTRMRREVVLTFER